MGKEKSKTELPQVMEGELKARLIKLREDAGYDTAQMADVMCLSEKVIINLENEEIDQLPQPAYVRGYLRNYAKLGDEDPNELIRRYEALRGSDAAELDYQIKSSTTISTSPQKSMTGVWSQLILLGVLVIGIALFSTIPSVKNWVEDTWDKFSTQLSQPSDASGNPTLTGDLPVPAPIANEAIVEPLDDTQNSSSSDTSTQTSINTNTSILESISNPDSTTLGSDTQNANLQNTVSVDSSTEESITENINTVINEQITAVTEDTSLESTTETTSINDEEAGNIESTENTDQIGLTSPEAMLALNTESASITDLLTSTENEIVIEETDVANTDSNVATGSNDLINIKLVFNAEVWLRIKDKENKTVFEGLNIEGTDKSIDLKKPLTFRVGNAQGLGLFVDNKAVDISSYINGSIANFTLE